MAGHLGFKLITLATILPGLAVLCANDGEVHGTILDPARAGINGARITAVPMGGGIEQSTRSDDKGEFSLELARGAYTLCVASEGFLESVQAVEVSGASPQSLEFVLALAATHQTITVMESAGYQVAAISSGTKTLTP